MWRAIETRCGQNRNHEIADGPRSGASSCPARYSATIVPTFFPSTMSVKLLGLFMSKTTIGILLSMQRLNAVESITLSRCVSASENVRRSKRLAFESVFGSRS